MLSKYLVQRELHVQTKPASGCKMWPDHDPTSCKKKMIVLSLFLLTRVVLDWVVLFSRENEANRAKPNFWHSQNLSNTKYWQQKKHCLDQDQDKFWRYWNFDERFLRHRIVRMWHWVSSALPNFIGITEFWYQTKQQLIFVDITNFWFGLQE